MEKTLGGDRLGSGKKIKVSLHGYERSTHDLGYIWRSTMSAGTLVPFMSEIALPGDTFDINLDIDIKTHPTIGPLFGSYKVQADIFLAPIRLYNAALHNNALNIGRNMAQIKLPQLTLQNHNVDGAEDIDNSQINPSSILSYLGIRGIGIGTPAGVPQNRNFNAVPYLAYWEIYKNYYANKQEEIGAVLHTPTVAIVQTITTLLGGPTTGQADIPLSPSQDIVQLKENDLITVNYTGARPIPSQIIIRTLYNGDKTLAQLAPRLLGASPGVDQYYYDFTNNGLNYAVNYRYQTASDIVQTAPEVVTFPLENIDTMRQNILAAYSLVTPFTLDGTDIAPYGYALAKTNLIPNALSSQEGLALKTYQSDLFNNWLSTEWIDGAGGITEVTAIDTSGGSFTLDTLNLSKKVYDMLNRIAVSGGSYDDWLDAVYAHDRITRAESPIYMGGLIKELVFQEVVSNTGLPDEAQPLGTLAGRGIMAKKHKGGHVTVKVDEPGYIIGIISLTPRVDYSQGNKWDVNLQTLDDLHKPALDQIGFQELITEQMAWWTTQNGGGIWTQQSAGKQPAWINYMTNVNQTRGNFAIESNEMFMTLNRRYEYGVTEIADLTTYIDPSKFNFIFANTAIDAQNFWAQIAVDITARRKMSAKVMPNL